MRIGNNKFVNDVSLYKSKYLGKIIIFLLVASDDKIDFTNLILQKFPKIQKKSQKNLKKSKMVIRTSKKRLKINLISEHIKNLQLYQIKD